MKSKLVEKVIFMAIGAVLVIASWFNIGCDDTQKPVVNIVTDIIEDVPKPTMPTYTYIGFRPSDNTLTPINPADEWDGWQDTIWQKARDRFYYSKHLLLDDWELQTSGRPNRHDTEFEHWIYAVASSKIIYDLSGGVYSQFDGYIGLMEDYDACGHGGTVEFIFGIDGIGVWRSGKLVGIRDTEPIHVMFDIPADAQNLTIIVTDGGDGICSDHWTIGDARLTIRVGSDVAISADITDVAEDIPETSIIDEATEPVYTYIGLRSDDDILAPLNPVREWDGWQSIVWQQTRDGFYYTRKLWRDEWELAEISGPFPWIESGPFEDDLEHWFYAVAASKFVYDLSGESYSKFDGYAAIRYDRSICGSPGTVEFIFLIDDVEVLNTGTIEGIAALGLFRVEFDIPADAQNLTIIVTDAGDGIHCDHWIIGDARLTHR